MPYLLSTGVSYCVCFQIGYQEHMFLTLSIDVCMCVGRVWERDDRTVYINFLLKDKHLGEKMFPL